MYNVYTWHGLAIQHIKRWLIGDWLTYFALNLLVAFKICQSSVELFPSQFCFQPFVYAKLSSLVSRCTKRLDQAPPPRPSLLRPQALMDRPLHRTSEIAGYKQTSILVYRDLFTSILTT